MVVFTLGFAASATTTVNSYVLPARKATSSIFNENLRELSLNPVLSSTRVFAASRLSPWVHSTDQAYVRAELDEHDAA